MFAGYVGEFFPFVIHGTTIDALHDRIGLPAAISKDVSVWYSERMANRCRICSQIVESERRQPDLLQLPSKCLGKILWCVVDDPVRLSFRDALDDLRRECDRSVTLHGLRGLDDITGTAPRHRLGYGYGVLPQSPRGKDSPLARFPQLCNKVWLG